MICIDIKYLIRIRIEINTDPKHCFGLPSFYNYSGTQGLLNDYFSSWATQDIHKHLPFIYNMVASATYSYLPAYKR